MRREKSVKPVSKLAITLEMERVFGRWPSLKYEVTDSVTLGGTIHIAHVSGKVPKPFTIEAEGVSEEDARRNLLNLLVSLGRRKP